MLILSGKDFCILLEWEGTLFTIDFSAFGPDSCCFVSIVL